MTKIDLGRHVREPRLRCAVAMVGLAKGRLRHWFWLDRTIQWQILAAFVLITFVAGMATAGVVVYSKRRDARTEMEASVEVAERLVRSFVEQIARDVAASSLRTFPLHEIETVPLQIRSLRHARIYMVDANEQRVTPLPTAEEDEQREERTPVPSRLLSLLRLDNPKREIPVTFRGEQVATVFVVGQPSHEIADAWHDLADLAPVVLIADAAVIGLLCVVLRRALTPLTGLVSGLKELEQGHFRYRLPRVEVRQLSDIADRFNALADALQATTMDNIRLNHRLITVQDDERRLIASELHDDLGSYLLGLRMNLLSLQRIIDALPADAAAAARDRVGTLVRLGEQLQTANRTLLKRIRPMAVGRAPLADVIADLVTDFERNDPDHTFNLEIGHIHRGYSDCIDLTVYRCIQEGLTNAVRHAQARSITVRLEQRATPLPTHDDQSTSAVLRLSVTDDGGGIKPGAQAGIGLTGMEERVRALGGALAISNVPGHGACLEIVIPLEAAQSGVPQSLSTGPRAP